MASQKIEDKKNIIKKKEQLKEQYKHLLRQRN